MDHTVYATAAALRDELSAMLNHTRAGHPGIAMVHPGDIVPMYGCPLAAVRVVNITPDTRTLRSGVCGTTLHIATLEMVVDRCYTTPDDNAMPTLGVLDSHARDAIDDAAAMRVAAQCFRTGPPSTLLGPWTSRVAGGILRGTLTCTVTIDLGCGCGTLPEAWPAIDDQVPPLPGDPRNSG